MRRDERNYDDAYFADVDYDTYATEDSYDDFELPTNDSTEYTGDCYAKFVKLQNMIRHSRKGRDVRCDYSRDLKSPPSRGTRTCCEQNGPPRWFANNDERNFREARDTDARSRRSPSSERRKRINVTPRMDKNFYRKSEFEKLRGMKNYQEKDALFPDASNSTEISQNGFWEFVPFENEANSEELMFSDIADSEREGKLGETRKRNSRDNLSPEIEDAKRRTLKKNAEMEKSKIVPPNLSNVSSPRVRSARTSTDDRLSNVYSAEKDLINARSHLPVEEKKTVSLTSAERKEESANSISARTNTSHQYRDRFVNKSSNKSSETNRPMKKSKRIANSKSNERTFIANKEHNANPHSKNLENNNTDRINVSRSTAEEITENKRTLTLKMTGTSWTEVEKEKKFSSKLPIRTWKRLRTKEPAAAMSPESNITNEDENQELQKPDIEIMHRNNHSVIPENEENHEEIVKDHASKDHSNIKRSDQLRFRTKLLNAGKPELTSTNIRKIKGSKAAEMREQRNKKLNIR
ncbi:hypothetical protein X777_10932 [Ooceraea biroi]|nr:hypothetical protein X777_10932 [Ooceraea biroi]